MIPASPIARHIGPVLRDRRVELGLTQFQLAKLVGTYRPLVARMERAVHAPSLDSICAYAKALGWTSEELIGRARLRAEGPP